MKSSNFFGFSLAYLSNDHGVVSPDHFWKLFAINT